MRWRSVIGFFAGRSFGSPLASKPSSTCGEARSGNTCRSVHQRELALLDELMPAAVVIAFVIEAIQNTLSAVIGSSLDSRVCERA